jgi:hypothetical protein
MRLYLQGSWNVNFYVKINAVENLEYEYYYIKHEEFYFVYLLWFGLFFIWAQAICHVTTKVCGGGKVQPKNKLLLFLCYLFMA